MKWTDKQLKAIETRNQNILVSAAAGSGKTAVLVERILRLVLEENINVNELLVVTFTKAAASEMKQKLIKAIKNRLTEGKGNVEFLRKQLELMPKALISTFHSFALDVIRNYYYVIDINPSLKIADEIEAELLKNKALDEVFENEFNREDNDDFIEFLNAYSSHKNENKVKETILSLYNRIMAMPKPYKWIKDAVDGMDVYKGDYKMTELYSLIISDIKGSLNRAFEYKVAAIDTLKEYGLERLALNQKTDLDYIDNIIKLMDTDKVDVAFDMINEYKSKVLRANKDEKDTYEMIKDTVAAFRKKSNEELKYIKNYYMATDLDRLFLDIYETKPRLEVLKNLILKFDDLYKQFKEDKKLMDFNDIEHFAIDILENDDVASEYREKIKYIFIDEYQDSNFLQEVIIDKIKRDNNLFLVGDIKQSIYRFRLAEPSIFQNRYAQYKDVTNVNSTKIDLNQNFRSKKPVLDFVNGLFKFIMDGYDDDAALYLGAKSKEEFNFKTELYLVNREKSLIAEDEVDEELLDLKAAQVEAIMTVKRIKELIGTSYYDHKEDKVKTVSYKDIVILMRGIKKWGDIFQDVLTQNDVPVYLNNNSGYFESLEINLLVDLLKVIDNSSQDIPLIGVLKSSVFNFTIDELIEIRLLNKYTEFNKVFKLYISKGESQELREKCKNALYKIKQWKELARFEPIESFVWKLIKDSGLYFYAASLTNGKQRQLNLRTFLDKTSDYSKTGDNSIYGLLEYIGRVKENAQVGQDSLLSEEDDTVQITTIHKSKGLEYPIVIIPGTTKKFNFTKISDMGTSHKDLGIGLSYVDKDHRIKRNTLLQRTIININKREELEEELRILYVAMTRAKDRLIIIGSAKDSSIYENRLKIDKYQSICYMDLIYPYIDKNTVYTHILDVTSLGEYVSENSYSFSKNRNLKKFIRNTKKIELDEIENIAKRIDYKYPYPEALETKSKYGVTELIKKNKPFEPKKSKKKKHNKNNVDGALLGTAYHSIMEFLDFKEATSKGMSYIKEIMDNLVENNVIDQALVSSIDLTKIDKFFRNDIGIRATKNNCVKEKMFTMLHNVDGVETMVQGIIDCYFEEDNQLVIIDYKSNYDTENIEGKYSEQLAMYKKVLEEATGKKVKEAYLYLFENNQALLINC